MSIVEVFPAPFGPRNAITSPEPMARATPRTACTEPKCLCTPRRSTASGGTARSWRPGSAARSASSRAICMARPAGLASDAGFLLTPAAFAAPPPWDERARALPAPCDVPDRQEHHNDHDNQLNTHPDTSWRAELLRRGVRSAWGDNPKVIIPPEPGVSWINLLTSATRVRNNAPGRCSNCLKQRPIRLREHPAVSLLTLHQAISHFG
jgi:hypothetical protein